MGKKVLIIGSGLGSLATALRLSSKGYDVEIVEKHHQAGGRLNQLKKDGFTLCKFFISEQIAKNY